MAKLRLIISVDIVLINEGLLSQEGYRLTVMIANIGQTKLVHRDTFAIPWPAFLRQVLIHHRHQFTHGRTPLEPSHLGNLNISPGMGSGIIGIELRGEALD